GVDDRVGVGVLQDIAGRAGNEHVADGSLLVHAAEGDHADPGLDLLQLPGRLDPVHFGHPDVHQDDVGRQTANHLDRLGPRARLADHLEVLTRQQEGERLTEAVVVVADEHAGAVRGAEGGGRAHLGSIGSRPPRGYPADVGFPRGMDGSAGWPTPATMVPPRPGTSHWYPGRRCDRRVGPSARAVQRSNVEVARDRGRQPNGRPRSPRTPERGTYRVPDVCRPARGFSRSAGFYAPTTGRRAERRSGQSNVPPPVDAPRATREE